MPYANIKDNKIVAVSYDREQLPIDIEATVIGISNELYNDLMSGKISLFTSINDSSINDVNTVHGIMSHFTGYGKYVNLQHMINGTFGKISDRSLLNNRHFFVWDWRHRYGHEITDAFPWQEVEKCKLSHPNDRISIILDNSLEAPDYYNHLKPLCDQLIQYGIQPKDILFWATIDEPDDIPIYNINTKRGYTVGINYNNFNIEYNTNTHFILLARNPRPLRLLMVDQVLLRKLDKYGNISCGSNGWDYDYSTTEYLSDLNRHLFPISFDGIVKDATIKQYDVSDLRIKQAAINVICETSQDKELKHAYWWIKPFITEKTSKALLLCQFPLFVSVPGIVDKVRRDGFDVFDDIVDHSYDNELDPRKRVKMVADQLEKLCAMSLTDIAALRQKHWDRLVNNRQKLLNLFNNINNINAHQFEQWLKDTQ